MNEDDNSLLGLKTKIMQEIYQNRMILTATRDKPVGWQLISGLWSPFYIQLRILSSFPNTLEKVGVALAKLLEEEAPHINRIVGVAFAGVPIATVTSIKSGIPACHTRKISGVRTQNEFEKALEQYGQHTLIEGVIQDGDSICLVDDLVTGMDSKFVARSQVLSEVMRRGLQGVKCDDIAVVLDRQHGAEQIAKKSGLRLHSLIKFIDEGLPTIKPLMQPDEYELIFEYLKNPNKPCIQSG
jgi:orotate phosphoribosyltransferase